VRVVYEPGKQEKNDDSCAHDVLLPR
jgi:hypothetical protein